MPIAMQKYFLWQLVCHFFVAKPHFCNMDATLVVAMGGGDAQGLVLWRINATRRHGLHHEAHHTSYYFCTFIKKVVGFGLNGVSNPKL